VPDAHSVFEDLQLLTVRFITGVLLAHIADVLHIAALAVIGMPSAMIRLNIHTVFIFQSPVF